MSELYTKIEELCKEKNTNITELCRELKIPRSPFSELKAGRSKTISTDKLVMIANYFNVSVDWLTGTSVYKNAEEAIDYSWGIIGDFECAFDFAPLLTELREERGVSIDDMAKSIGATDEQYVEIEAGTLPITREQAETLCKMLDTNVSQVLFDNELYDEYVPEEYHNDVQKWEILKQYDELDRQASVLYPNLVKDRNNLPLSAKSNNENEHEQEVLNAYRKAEKPLRDGIDRMLGVEPLVTEQEAKKIV